MRLLTQLEALLAGAATAKERYVLLERSGCLARRSGSHRAVVERLLDVRDAGYVAGSPHQPPPGHPPVEEGIVESLRDGGYLSEHGLPLSRQWPADRSTVERLRQDAARGPLQRWWRQLLGGRGVRRRN